MTKNFDNVALIIIDVQQAFEDKKWNERNNMNVAGNICRLLNAWRKIKYPVIHIQHLSDNTQSICHSNNQRSAFRSISEPLESEATFQRKVSSAFIGTQLEEHLRTNNIKKVVIVGLTTPHSVSTTTQMSGDLGFETYLVSDATAASDIKRFDNTYCSAEEVHTVSLATLDGEFATVLTTESIMGKLPLIEVR